MAGHQHRDPACGEAVEQLPQVPADQRVEPDGRLVEDQQLRRTEQGDREREPALLPTGQLTTQPPHTVGQPDIDDHPVHIGRRDAQHRGEVAEILHHGEVRVDRRVLRGVTDPAAQRRRPGRMVEYVERTGVDHLCPDDRAHQGRPTRTESPLPVAVKSIRLTLTPTPLAEQGRKSFIHTATDPSTACAVSPIRSPA